MCCLKQVSLRRNILPQEFVFPLQVFWWENLKKKNAQRFPSLQFWRKRKLKSKGVHSKRSRPKHFNKPFCVKEELEISLRTAFFIAIFSDQAYLSSRTKYSFEKFYCFLPCQLFFLLRFLLPKIRGRGAGPLDLPLGSMRSKR